MGTSAKRNIEPLAVGVRVTPEQLSVELDDGRTISVPLTWYPRLLYGTPAERAAWELIANGIGIHWPALDEDISVEGLMDGLPSGESQRSFEEWLRRRQQG
jgi:Protein of unknown function (DUF2442)